MDAGETVELIAHQPDWYSISARTPPWIEYQSGRSWLMPSMPMPPCLCRDPGTHHDCSPLLQISTDFVLSSKQGHPYRPEDPLNPVSPHGASKSESERAVAELLGIALSCTSKPVSQSTELVRINPMLASARSALNHAPPSEIKPKSTALKMSP